MSSNNPVTEAIEIVGLQALADGCGVSYQAVRKWEKKGLPRSEWTGETNHSHVIEKLTKKLIKRSRLIKWTESLRKIDRI